MPPKAARGARTPRGGRGRGKAVAEPEPSAPTIKSEEPELQSLEHTPSIADASVPATTTPQNGANDDSAAPSPNSSPATVPTETPAPTPVRVPPVRAESSSSTAAPASAARGRGRGGLSVALGQRGKPVTESKFKPRAIRRDAGERERIKKEEMDKQAALEKQAEAEAARIARGLASGRGRGGRGRGDRMDRVQTSRNINSASGLFGVAPEEMARRTDFNAASRLGGSGGGGGGSSGGGGGGGSTGGKPGLGVRSDPSGTKIKSEGGTDAGVPEGSTRKKYVYDPTFVPEYDDDDDDTERIDIDTMNDGWKLERDGFVVTGSKSKEKEKVLSSGTMMPIRLTRVHHETKKAYINIDEDSEIKPKTEEVEGGIDGMEIDEARSSPPPTTTEAAPIKAEADFDDETIAPNKAPAPPSTPSSPESKRKVAKEVKVDPPSSPETKKKARKPELPKSPEAKLSDKKFQRDSTRNEVKPVLQTEEDQAEYDRHLDEMEHLVKELGGVRPPRRPDADGDEFMEDGKEEAFELDGKLFLFQFPPVLPSLYNPKKSSKPENKKSKQETKKAAAAVEISPSKGGKTAKVKNEPETEEKVEPEIVIEEETKLVEEEGWVGKMVVRKSGKVELVWGGTSMVVHAGTAGDFLSTAVVVDGRERPVVNQLREPGEPEGSAVGMGKIFGKYVVVPDWEKLS